MERNIGTMTTMPCNLGSSYLYQKRTSAFRVISRRKERDRDHSYPYKVIEITPPKNLGIRCLPENLPPIYCVIGNSPLPAPEGEVRT